MANQPATDAGPDTKTPPADRGRKDRHLEPGDPCGVSWRGVSLFPRHAGSVRPARLWYGTNYRPTRHTSTEVETTNSREPWRCPGYPGVGQPSMTGTSPASP